MPRRDRAVAIPTHRRPTATCRPFAGLALAVLVACSDVDPPTNSAALDAAPVELVLARLGEVDARLVSRAGGRQTAPAPERVQLLRESRPGLCFDSGHELWVTAPVGTARVAFAVGLRGEAVGQGELHAVVEHVGRDEAEPVSQSSTPIRVLSLWHEGELDFGSPLAGGRRLRFATRGQHDEREVCWGSVRFYGTAEDDARPDVVLIVLDTLGERNLAKPGTDEPLSPELERVFAEAFRFERAIAPYGNTLTSHATLFSTRINCPCGLWHTRPVFDQKPAPTGRIRVA